jgi:hypothetical protein
MKCFETFFLFLLSYCFKWILWDGGFVVKIDLIRKLELDLDEIHMELFFDGK